MTLCSYYYFAKLLHLLPSKKQYSLVFVMAVALSIVIYFANQYVDLLNTLILVVLFCSFVLLQYRLPIKITFVASVISCGMSYITFSIASIPVSVFAYMFFSFLDSGKALEEVFVFIISGVFS